MATRLAPGPVQRDDFFEEQARRRRQTWRYSALSGLAAAAVGVPLAMFLTPLAFLVAIGVLRLADDFLPVPDAVWEHLREVAGFVPAFLTALSDAPSDEVLPWLRYAFDAVPFPFGSPVLTAAALILPGMATMVLIWLAYRALFATAGVGGTLLALGTRDPNPADIEERQLVNLIEEMALAAGLPAPRVRMIDSPIPNMAAIGASHEDAVVLATRGILDRLDRDETQGVVAHVIGSTGNGDLRIFTSITTFFQSLELIFTVLDALFNLSPSAWKSLWLTFRLAVTGGRDRRAAETIARMMDHRLGEFREDGITALLADAHSPKPRRTLGKVFRWLPPLQIVFLPFLLLHILALFLGMQVSMFRLMVVAPLLMRVPRTRRYLADATAVQLTRNPDGLADALARLAVDGGPVPGGQWFSHLFIVGSEAEIARSDATLAARVAATRHGVAAGETGAIEAARRLAAEAAEGRSGSRGTWAQELAGAPSHPQIHQRVFRLERLGAQGVRVEPYSEAERAARAGQLRGRIRSLLGTIVALPLMAIVGVLTVFVTVMLFAFGAFAAIAFMGMMMAGIFALLG